MKLYNTLSRKVEELRPLDGHNFKIYTCGITVYSHPHIGNWVGYIYWDVLQHTLEAEDYTVVRTQNYTDVGHLTSDDDNGEDKMEKGARAEGITAWDVADRYIAICDHEAYDVLALTRPTYLVRATSLIREQIQFVKSLESMGYTYLIDGDGVYFDTSKLKNYGELARLDIEGLDPGSRVSIEGKRNITDFALWKLSPIDSKRDMEWDSPWGKGFPGWHLECSVIARETLGDQIDIHCGGIDHIPVHHTNEIAQTESLTGKQFSQIWAHNNHVKVDGTKMSKSIGNLYTLDDIVSKGFSPMAFKLLVLSKHYRTEGNFSWEILASAQNRLSNWQDIAALRWQTGQERSPVDFKEAARKLREHLANDLDTPSALAYIDEIFSNIPDGVSTSNRESFDEFLTTVDTLLGIKLRDATPDISPEISELLENRAKARDNKDWSESDSVRGKLLELGISVRDTANGQLWAYSHE